MILVVVLLLVGAAGLGWGQWRQRSVAGQIAEARRAVADAPSADAYLALYEEWSQLAPLQKAETPWGKGRYGGPEIQKRLRASQQERFWADVEDLNSGVKSYPQQLADVLYGMDWNQRLAAYQRGQDIGNLSVIVAIVSLSAGGLLAAAGLIKGLVLWIGRRRHISDQPSAATTEPAVKENSSYSAFEAAKQPSMPAVTASAVSEQTSPSPKLKIEQAYRGGYFGAFSGRQSRPVPADAQPVSAAAATVKSEPSSKDAQYFGWAMDTQEQAADCTATLMTTEPVSRGLSELTEEVSAIRQYAAAQQDQMRKLQDGYDWMIIRRFCLRVIRCVDNLDDRLAKLGNKEQDLSACLEDIRDELVFALESSGVEQYQPDVNAPFKGLEKYAEAVRQRVAAPDASLAGAIAEVIRPGYQYLISDDDVKIVRCAQVKLYDAAEAER